MSSAHTVANANALLAMNVNGKLLQLVPKQSWTALAKRVMDNAYPSLVTRLETKFESYGAPADFLSTLSPTAQAALEDLGYIGTSYVGPRLTCDLVANNIQAAAEELAFNTYNPDASNGPLYRAMVDATALMGFTPTISGSNTIQSLSGQVNTSTVTGFLKYAETTKGTPPPHFGRLSPNDMGKGAYQQS
jgi:hypothetical protein